MRFRGLWLFVVVSVLSSASVFAESVRFRLDATDENGNVIDTVKVGDTFILNAYTEDLRSESPLDDFGVFAAYFDLTFEPTLVSGVGPIEAGVHFQNGTNKAVISDGFFDNVGGFSSAGENGLGGLNPLGMGEFLVFSTAMEANAVGEVQFETSFAANPPSHDVLVFGSLEPVLADDIEFGSLSLQIAEVPEPSSAFLMGLACIGVFLRRKARRSEFQLTIRTKCRHS